MTRIVFLDRDGVINRSPKEYVTYWEEFTFIPRAAKAIKLLNKNKFKVFIISNQAGVQRRLFSQEDLDAITRNMLREIKKQGGNVDGVYYCVHTEARRCSCRKPKTGLLKKAVRGLSRRERQTIDFARSYFVGDDLKDMQAGRDFGVNTIFVLSGKNNKTSLSGWPIKPDFVARDLWEAVNKVICK